MENNKTLKQLLIAILVAICSAIVAFFFVFVRCCSL